MRKRLAVLATALVIGSSAGCSSDNPIFQQLSQQQFEDCLTENVFTMLRLVSKLQTIMGLIADQGTPPADIVINNSDLVNYTFQCDFAVSGAGANDTRVTGAILFASDPVANGLTGSIQINNVIIASIAPSGTLTGSAQVVLAIVDENTTTMTGQVVLNDDGCDTTLNLNQPLTMTAGLPVGPVVQSTFLGLGISGLIDYITDFIFAVVEGQIDIPAESQTVSVTTDSSLLGTVIFDLFPAEEVVSEMAQCLFLGLLTGEGILEAIEDLLAEFGGDDQPNVTLALPNFTVTGEGFQMTGTITGSAAPFAVTFSFTIGDPTASGQTKGTMLVTPPVGETPGVIDGAYSVTFPESTCAICIEFSGVEFAGDQNFDVGIVTITVTLGEDELVLRLDVSEEEIIDAISGTFNGIVLPPEALVQLFPF